MTLTNSELVSRFRALADYTVKADSGSTTTLVSSRLKDVPEIKNFYVCFTTGDNFGIDRIITDFDYLTGTITFDEVTAITNVDEVCILKNGFLTEIKQAEIFMTNEFRNRGLDISLFLTIAQLKEAHIYKSLELVCCNLMRDAVDDDTFFVASEKYKMLYEKEIASLIADYDSNNDGIIQDAEKTQQIGQVGFMR